MDESEQEIDELEKEIPAYCAQAVREAFQRALASGQPVLASGVTPEGTAVLYEISPDGSRRIVKELEPRTPVEMGLRLIIP